MAQQITIDIVADTKKLTSGINDVSKQIGGLDDSVKKVQSLTTAFVGVGVAAKGFSVAGNFINETTDAASDLEETLSKTNVLFGKSATEVVKFSESAAKGLGQSKQQALDAAATFATFGKAAGLAGDDLVGFSTDFVGLASDLASFNNTSPEQAINAIGSALRGESEPLRSYGVLLNDAALRQAALELGIVKTTKDALTPQQKVLAAQKVIYEQTTAAQGDFARTSDGLANSTRILEAQQANLNSNIGTTFLPIMKQVNEIMLLAVGIFTSLPGPIQKIVVGFGLFVAVIAPTIILVSSLKTAFITLTASTVTQTTATGAATTAQKAFNLTMLANPITLVIAAIVAIIAVIVLLVKNWDSVTAAVGKVWEAIRNFGVNAWNTLKEFAGKIPQFVITIVNAFNGLPAQMLALGKNVVTGLWNGITSMASWLKNNVTGFFKNLVPSWAEKALGISSPSKVFASIGKNIVGGLESTFNAPAVQAVSNAARAGIAVPTASLPSLMSGKSASAINVTINAGLGTDPYTLGREVNNALTKYGKVSNRVVRG
jgi:phage-related minor tail protein